MCIPRCGLLHIIVYDIDARYWGQREGSRDQAQWNLPEVTLPHPEVPPRCSFGWVRQVVDQSSRWGLGLVMLAPASGETRVLHVHRYSTVRARKADSSQGCLHVFMTSNLEMERPVLPAAAP